MRPFSLVVGGLMLGSASASAALWSQDEDEVVIYVAADCDMATVVAAARSDGFSFECNAGGSAVSVAFESREDLVAGGAECAKAGDRVACTLSKYHGGHLWDRLWDFPFDCLDFHSDSLDLNTSPDFLYNY